MALVDYSDSDDDAIQSSVESSHGTRNGKQATASTGTVPLPPASFHNLYATAARASTSDDPTLHGGRKRNTPHVEGNWPTHVYLEWFPNQMETAELTRLLEVIQLPASSSEASQDSSTKLHSLLQNDLGVPLPLHISLSRSLMLQSGQREDFRHRLEAAIRGIGIRGFSLNLGDPRWVSNYEGTRSFLVLGIDHSRGNELNRLLHACNTTCSRFGLQELYKPNADIRPTEGLIPDRSDAFHFSIGWRLAPTSGQSADSVMGLDLATPQIKVACSAVKLKIGNEIIDINFN